MKRLTLLLAAALLALPVSTAFPAQLLKTGSFEAPPVKARTPIETGGTPMLAGGSDWALFLHPPVGEQGLLTAGITQELAHTGKQSIYIEFNKFTAEQQGVMLESKLVSILPAKPYHVAIWGRMPRKSPLTIDQRLVYLKLFVEFFQADRETQTGNPAAGVRIQPIPGSLNLPPFFTTARWSEYFADNDSPADAAFMKVTWKWETPPSAGVTSGVIFFDDATISGEAGPQTPDAILAADDDDEMDEKAAAEKVKDDDDDDAPAPPPAPAPAPEKPADKPPVKPAETPAKPAEKSKK